MLLFPTYWDTRITKKHKKKLKQPHVRDLLTPMLGPDNLYMCKVSEVGLISDALLGWRPLDMPKDLSGSPRDAALHSSKCLLCNRGA